MTAAAIILKDHISSHIWHIISLLQDIYWSYHHSHFANFTSENTIKSGIRYKFHNHTEPSMDVIGFIACSSTVVRIYYRTTSIATQKLARFPCLQLKFSVLLEKQKG